MVRAGTLGLPLALAIIGGEPERFAPLVDLYREAARRAGHDPATLPVGINSHGFVADTSQQAADEAFPPYAEAMTRIGRERGWPPTTARAVRRGARRSAARCSSAARSRWPRRSSSSTSSSATSASSCQFSVGRCRTPDLMHSIELFGTKVAPVVRKALG